VLFSGHQSTAPQLLNSTTVSAVKDDAMRQVKLPAEPRLAWASVLLLVRARAGIT
jgi:hypothetical protein